MRLLTVGVFALVIATGTACGRERTVSAQGADRSATAAEPAASPDASAQAAPAPTAAPAAPAAASESPSPAEAAPKATAASWRQVTIPAGTNLPIVLDTGVGSDISQIEQPVSAHLARAVLVQGRTAIPAGSPVTGVVTDAKRSGKVKGLAHVAMRFDTLTPRGDDERYRIHTTPIGRTAPNTHKKDAETIGIPAAGGALIGAIVGGGKGAAIGAAAGGGAGTAVVLSTRGKEVHVPRGSALTLRLTEPVTVKVRS